MTRGKSTEAATLEGPDAIGPDARFAELCGPEGADDEESADDHPGYGSLLGLGVRKQPKKPVIMLDPEVAEQAAQVMEINAGQLVVRGGQPGNGFGSLGLGGLGDGEDAEKPLEAFGATDRPEVGYDDEEEDELDPAVAEWAARVPGSIDDEEVEGAADAAWPEEEPVEPEEAYEASVEAAETWDEEPAVEEAAVEEAALEEAVAEEPVYEAPLHEEAVVEEAWLEWARALIEPPAPAEGMPLAEEADEAGELADLPEPEEALAHTVDDIAPVEPELPKHELRQMLAQISRPRQSRRLWRRLLAFLKRLFA